MVDFVGLLILAGLVVLFGYLAYRSWGSKRRWLKWVGLVVSSLLTILFGMVLIVVVIGTMSLNQNYNASNPVVEVKVAGTAEQIARGQQLIKGCGCHGENLGGTDFAAEAGIPVGTLYARNLTPGGDIKDWSDGEIVRAIREGVHKSGRSLIIMPSATFRNMSDEDVQSVVAYLRSTPAVTPDAPPNNLNALGAALIGTVFSSAISHQPHITAPVVAPPKGVTAEYGKYMLSIIGCTDCHGQNLAGGVAGGGPPPGPNLTTIVPNWTEQDFLNLMRKGTEPDGKVVGEEMPWQEYDKMLSDDELRAIYLHLHGLTRLPDNQ